MCVCVYVCVYVCVCVCFIYVFFMYVCMYVCTHARTHTHTHKHTNIQVNAKRQYVSVEWDSGDYAPLLYVGQKDLFQLAVFDDPFSSADNQGAGGGGGVGADGRGGEGGRAPVTPNYVPGVLSGGRQERGQANLYASQTTTLQAEMSETQPSPPPSVAVSRGGLLSLSLSLSPLSLSLPSLSLFLSLCCLCASMRLCGLSACMLSLSHPPLPPDAPLPLRCLRCACARTHFGSLVRSRTLFRSPPRVLTLSHMHHRTCRLWHITSGDGAWISF